MFHVDFKCSIKHETNVAADFFLIINGWLTTIFQHVFYCRKRWFLMLQIFQTNIATLYSKCLICSSHVACKVRQYVAVGIFSLVVRPMAAPRTDVRALAAPLTLFLIIAPLMTDFCTTWEMMVWWSPTLQDLEFDGKLFSFCWSWQLDTPAASPPRMDLGGYFCWRSKGQLPCAAVRLCQQHRRQQTTVPSPELQILEP